MSGTDSDDAEWEMEEEEINDDESDAQYARRLQLLENAKVAAEDNPDIIPFDKGYEVCCFVCRCRECDEVSGDEERKLEVLSSGKSCNVRLHRKCCSTIKKIDVDDSEYVVTSYGLALTNPSFKKRRVETAAVTFDDLRRAKDQADRLRVKVLGDESYHDPVSHRFTDERYTAICQNFEKVKNNQPKIAINVLSIFSGIGSDLLVLKRLSIAINNCVVVEHDPFAQVVCEANHKKDVECYHPISTFEELENDLETVMIEKGRGPPCVEFSGANANREGVQSVKGGYMLRFGQLINSIRQFNRENKVQDPFFFCENVPMRWEDQEHVEYEFGISPVLIDALQMSPSKRCRAYYLNFPINELPPLDSAGALSVVHLNDAWMTLPQMYCHLKNKPTPYDKALTFMASEARLDDKRMIKVKVNKTSRSNPPLIIDHYSVADRESLLGYPVGYLENVLFQMFEKLEKAFLAEDWFKEALECGWDIEEIQNFSGRCYRFEFNGQGLSLKVGTMDKNRRGDPLYYLNCEQYCKRLLGNGFSIPVVEHLLCPIKDLFLRKTYNDASYKFVWE
ncbi:hypothetical protein HJC23_006257 [Cyclotella cryptica]|uniref:DNA (cytosine-5-)-methyltransferase n=1 Tax=Cyclotella cryptica TaxID=29204 RepID=A0ABD3PMF3_9STRA